MSVVQQRLDARRLRGNAVVWRAHYALRNVDCGRVLLVTASDPASRAGIETFCKSTGNELLHQVEWDGEYTYLIRKHCSEPASAIF